MANGNNDSISILDPRSYEERDRIALSPLRGHDRTLRGVQPVGLALSPDERYLYVAEAGVNAVAVIRLDERSGQLFGHIPTGWWPSAVQVSADGKTLYVANARGRGASPNLVGESQSPKFTVLGTVNIIPKPSARQLEAYTDRVYANNGFVEDRVARDPDNPIPSQLGKASDRIKHVIFINKENATHDLMLGDIARTRRGVPVNGEPAFSLGYDASPNHHELALRFAFSDNFFLEPSVSSDGHRWLTGQYTTEIEETHWPASYGGKRNDSGDDPAVFLNYPGRIGFTDANASPEPNDYNEQGGIYLHLNRFGKSFVNFGNGYEFAVIDEDRAAPIRRAPASTSTCRWKRWSATTATTCSRLTTPISPMRRCPRIRRDSAASAASSRCSRATTSTTGEDAASCRSTWTSITRTITAAVHATSIRTDRTGRSSASSRTTTRRSA